MIRGFFLSECQAPLGILTDSYEFARRSIIGMSIIIGTTLSVHTSTSSARTERVVLDCSFGILWNGTAGTVRD